MQSERREEYITRIQDLNQKSQTELMLVINQVSPALESDTSLGGANEKPGLKMIQLDDSENTEQSFDRSTVV